MSAYIMDPAEIAHIGKFVSVYGHSGASSSLFVYRRGREYSENYRTPQQVAETLMRENVRSVNYRYEGRTKVPAVDVSAIPTHEVSMIEVARLLRIWEYQASERPDFKRSEAYDTYVALLELLVEVLAARAKHLGA